jgi:hypothetical protein
MSTNRRHVVVLAGWKIGFRTIDLMKLICARTQLRLAAAKSIVERILDGEKVELFFESSEEAERFQQDASETGAIVHSSTRLQ